MTIPTTEGRVEPVYGWAAVAPDGTLRPMRWSETYMAVWNSLCGGLVCDVELTAAYRAGWRVIRVQISPAGE